MIAIVDSGLGNLASVRNAFHAIGADASLTADPELVRQADGVVLPGVGAAAAGMKRLRERGLDRAVLEAAHAGRPVLGLCLGMQLLFDGSEEGDVPCLSLLPGTVSRMTGEMKVPHIGWNQVTPQGAPHLWQGMPEHPYFYFVHSYICRPDDAHTVAGVTDYGTTFCSVVADGSIWGTQFHPERSGRVGRQLLTNFVALCRLPSAVQPAG